MPSLPPPTSTRSSTSASTGASIPSPGRTPTGRCSRSNSCRCSKPASPASRRAPRRCSCCASTRASKPTRSASSSRSPPTTAGSCSTARAWRFASASRRTGSPNSNSGSKPDLVFTYVKTRSGSDPEFSGGLRHLLAGAPGKLVHHDAFHGIDRIVPRRALEHAPRVVDPGLPARPDAVGREVEVLEVVLARERRREEPHHMHHGGAAPGGELFALLGFFRIRRKVPRQLANHVAHAVDLLLTRDMAVGAARVVDVLLPSQNLPHRLGLGAGRLPDVDREDHRVAPGIVVEHRLERRVRVDPAVPIRLALDADRGGSRRPRAPGPECAEPER